MSNDGRVGPGKSHRPQVPVSGRDPRPEPKGELPRGTSDCGAAGDRGGRTPPSPCPPKRPEQRGPSGRRAPAYSFGQRVEGPVQPRSPGPQYLVPAGLTAQGWDHVPAFSMGGRLREQRDSNTPGPAHYYLERADRVTLPSAPACSVTSRSRPNKPQQTPGPASYQLPPVMGPRLVNKRSAPQYTLTGRGPSIFEDKKKTPGPSNYGTVDTNVYMARAPRCTMAGRNRPKQASETPSPSDYNPKERRKQGQSFGVRHSELVVPVMDWQL